MVITFYSCLGVKVKEDYYKGLEKEGIIFDSGKIRVTFTSHNLSGPGFMCKQKKQISRGRLITTQKRLVAFIGGYKVIDIPKSHSKMKFLQFNKVEDKRFEISVDYSNFSDTINGDSLFSYHINPGIISDF